MLNIGIIGYGYWGINLLRNFMATPDCRVRTVCDQRPERLTVAQRNFPGVGVTTSVESGPITGRGCEEISGLLEAADSSPIK